MDTDFKNLPVIDWALCLQLAGYQESLAHDILSMITATLADDISTIKQLYKNKNPQPLQNHLHKLHGALCYCGLPRLKILIRQLETKLKNNIMDSLPSLLSQLDTEVSLVLEHYSRLQH